MIAVIKPNRADMILIVARSRANVELRAMM
jgi:hypothetical protein